jgi:pimeloyl-ACP methyl ester carboxylesterase
MSIPLHFEEFGTGHPLVLLHAFPMDHTMYAPQHELSKSHRLLLPDLPGFGQSPRHEGWTVDSCADALADWLDELKISEPVLLGGVSMGGYVALAFARKYPNKLKGLILADTRSKPDNAEAKANRDKSIAMVKEAGVPAFFAGMLPKLVTPANERLFVKLRQMAALQPAEGVTDALIALRDRPDATPGLQSINVPTLVIVGELDALTPPSCAEAMMQHLPKGTLVVIPGAGHLSNIEAPDAFNAAIRTWAKGLN